MTGKVTGHPQDEIMDRNGPAKEFGSMQTIKLVRSRVVAGVRALHNDEAGQLAVENIAIIGLSAIIMLFAFQGMFGGSTGDGLAKGKGEGMLGGILSKGTSTLTGGLSKMVGF